MLGLPSAGLGVLLSLQPSAVLAVQDPDEPTGKKPCDAVFGPCAGSEIQRGGVTSGVADYEDVPALVRLAQSHSPQACTYHEPPESFDQRVDVADTIGIPAGAVYFIKSCDGADEWHWYLPGTPETSDLDAMALIGRAFAETRPSEPRLVTSPPLGSQVVTGLPMYLAVDDVAFSEHTGSVSAGQFTVTATVTPVSTWFSPGDQHEPRTCEGAGTVWSSGERPTGADCTHTFTHTPAHLHGAGETYTVTSRVTYQASYTVTGPILAGTYDLGTFEGPEASVEVPVIERRAVRTTATG